jgi:hypothetical protein
MFLWSTPFTSLYGGPSLDFYTFQQAGRAWLTHGNPYNLTGQAAGFIYPPTSLPFYGMFASFDFQQASILWFIVYFSVFLVALLSLALTIEGERRYVYVSLAVLLVLTSYPLLFLMQWGQSDLLVAGFAILGLVGERLNHRFTSAALLSIATLLKGPAVVLLIYFVIFRRDLRYLGCFLISTCLIVGVSLLVVPVGLYWYYLTTVIPTLSVTLNPGGQSFARYLLLGLIKLTPVVSLAGVCLFGYFAFWVGSKNLPAINERTLSVDGMFLMNVLIMLQLNLRSDYYQYVAVILPLALFLSALLMENVKIEYLALVGFSTFLLNSVVAPDFLGFHTYPFEMVGNVMLTLGIILMYLRPATVIRHLKTR